MNFINEIKRYWNINLKNLKKSIVPMIFNFIVVIIMYVLLDDIMTETYVVSYCIAWLLLTSQLSLTQEMLQDSSKRRMKYFFMGTNSLTKTYSLRYLIVCIKYTILFFVFIKLTDFIGIIHHSIRLYEAFWVCIGLFSLFFMNYCLTLIVVINKKMLMAINFFKCIILFFIIKKPTVFLPASYVFHNLGNHFFSDNHFNLHDGLIIGINSIVYIILGYLICIYFTNMLKHKLVE
ncbi:MAG: hypothetical protein IKB07_00325 [Lachnospiraceae bacterium]|nr:hypothetical protein [Lachnospiraceae bacterium]